MAQPTLQAGQIVAVVGDAIAAHPVVLHQSGDHLSRQLAALIPLKRGKGRKLIAAIAHVEIAESLAQSWDAIQRLLRSLIHHLSLSNGIELTVQGLRILGWIFETQLA